MARTSTNRRVGIAAARQKTVCSETVAATHSLRRERTQAARNAAARVPATLPIPAVDVFRARAEARAWLVYACLLDLQTAVDGLQEAAELTGLVKDLGQDAIQKMMAAAFAIVPRLPPTEPNPDQRNRPVTLEAAPSTLMAAEYLVRQNDAARLKAWLSKHTAAECAAILQHIERKRP